MTGRRMTSTPDREALEEKASVLHEAMLHAAWAATAAWSRYLEASTVEEQRGLDLLQAYRWMRRHVRLASARRHARYDPAWRVGDPLDDRPGHWPNHRLSANTIGAIERRVSGMATDLLKLESLSSSSDLVKVRKALQMEGRGRGPKETHANALSRSAGRHCAAVIERLVRAQQKYLSAVGRLPQWPTVELRLQLVADAHDTSIYTVRRAWAAARLAQPSWQELHDMAVANQREIRKRERAAAAPVPSVATKKAPNRANFKAGIGRDVGAK